MYNHFFEFLYNYIDGSFKSADELEWGTEISRLPPATIEAFQKPVSPHLASNVETANEIALPVSY